MTGSFHTHPGNVWPTENQAYTCHFNFYILAAEAGFPTFTLMDEDDRTVANLYGVAGGFAVAEFEGHKKQATIRWYPPIP